MSLNVGVEGPRCDSDCHPFIGSADWPVHARNAGLFPQDPPIFVEESLDPNTPLFRRKNGSKMKYQKREKKLQGPFLLLMGIPNPASDRPGL